MAQVEELQNRALDAENTLEEVKMELLQVSVVLFIVLLQLYASNKKTNHLI